MTRSRPARLLRPVAACLMLGALAACGGGARQQAAAPTAMFNADWPRPGTYDPPGPPGDPWGPWIAQASRRFDVPERWIREVMRQESGGRQSATSRVGAMGLMQVMPGTYAELSRRYGLGGDPYHPWDNIMAGTAYIREMYELYGAPAFLAAYNAGPRRLEDFLWGSRGLPDETRNYVARIGPRIAGTHPNRRAAPEIYAAAEMPFDIPRGPRRGDASTMLALREQRRAVDPGVRVAQLPPGPVVRMEPIPDGSTLAAAPPAFSAGNPFAPGAAQAAPAAPRTQLASAGLVVAMAPVASPGDFERRMEPVVSPGDRAAPPPGGEVVAMAPVVSPGDLVARIDPVASPGGRVTRMDPVVSPGDPGSIRAEPLPPVASPAGRTALAAAPVAPAASRGFALIPQAQAGTLPSGTQSLGTLPLGALPRGQPSAPLAAPPPAVAAGGGWAVQVGAFASENLARAAAGQAREQIGAAGLRTAVEAVPQGRTTLFRARVTGLASRSAADQACDRLRGRGACMVVAPGI